MFNLAKLLRSGEGHSDGEARLELLLLSRDPASERALSEIARENSWILTVVPSSEQAVALLERRSIPIVICDRDIPEDWRTVLFRLSQAAPAACVLLASTVTDDYLWREVVHHRGFDVVRKPFEAERVVRAVRFAWWSHRPRMEGQAAR